MIIRRILVLYVLTLFIETTVADAVCSGLVCERCNSTECPQCHPISMDSCCQQVSAVLALTVTSLQASAYAIAEIQAGISVSTKIIVDVSALVSSGSFVSIVESFSLSLNPDRYCNATGDVAAYIKNYVDISSLAATEVQQIANIVSNAFNNANQSFAIASTLYSTAESIINSTCCGFDSQVYELVAAAGQYLGNASLAVNFGQNISNSVNGLATLVNNAYESVNSTAGSFLSASIDNCCNNTLLSRTANNSLAELNGIIVAAANLIGNIQNGCDQIAAFSIDNSTLASAATVIASTNTSMCANVLLSCCTNSSCCTRNETVSTAADAIGNVLVSFNSLTQAYQNLSVATKAEVLVLVQALNNATTGVKGASYAAMSIGISISSCCSVVVSIDSLAISKASQVTASFIATNAAANAVLDLSPSLDVLLQASINGGTSATSLNVVYGAGCCGFGCCSPTSYTSLTISPILSDCCSMLQDIKDPNTFTYTSLGSSYLTQAYNIVHSVSQAADPGGASDCASAIRKATASSKFALNVCCCTTASPTTVTATKAVATTTVVSRSGNSINDVINFLNRIRFGR